MLTSRSFRLAGTSARAAASLLTPSSASLPAPCPSAAWRCHSVRHAHIYAPNIKRNHAPFIDFETGFPKKPLPQPHVVNAFTMAKQTKILRLLEGNPQRLFQGRVMEKLSWRRLKHSGRNETGQITTRHRGGGHPMRIRFVDFKRARRDIYCTVLRIEHSPDRGAHVALVQYEDGVLSYIIAPRAIRPGDRLLSSENANIGPGNCLPLRKIPVGTIIHNLEIRPGCGGQFIRAAGACATILSKDDQHATIKLMSTEIRKFPLDCWATVGQVSNVLRSMTILGKAGTNRHLGRRPEVRGVAMNPSNHPHGGGNGAENHKPRKSLWGVCIWEKTRCPKRPSSLIVRRPLCGRLNMRYGIAGGRGDRSAYWAQCRKRNAAR
ncbi:unnamed protein product [Vitrella brassicaformis CCMP3155]|uniref:Uncharacterized protein n=2 Tax=Vitrella brassicaformis TaxID=1169539 RepID=A0A0G4G0E8_VITBC|nr:unnamed protein product [Vitrella brassicaformis CCMP3155]|mmetsp:Transcript_49646/g.124517  ORF Transcript_49646/g.124517 Transcript_49646/m.124517 type:complete len:378 (+) Transcript_49646:29-1162(+)|eukprot:CEM21164.1 unnamed protein product [Vitrella brassicaformis CCMP3155]